MKRSSKIQNGAASRLQNYKERRSLRSYVWLYFICFTVLILVLIWLFQYVFLDSYYQTAKVRDIQKAAKEITESFDSDDRDDIIRRLAFENSLCVLITDEMGNKVILENNIGSFLNTARKYDIDYALKRDSSTTPPTYHVFFETSRSENFQKAFSEYANNMQSRITSKTASQIINREQMKENAKLISQKTSERSAEKHLSKSEISGR